MGHEESTQQEITDVQRFAIGVAMLIWSLACAIFVGVSISASNPNFVGLVGGAGVLLAVLPLAGAYPLITGIIGIFKVDSEESH